MGGIEAGGGQVQSVAANDNTTVYGSMCGHRGTQPGVSWKLRKGR